MTINLTQSIHFYIIDAIPSHAYMATIYHLFPIGSINKNIASRSNMNNT